MKFRTEISIKPFPVQIDYTSKIFGLGSCFIDNIKQKLDYYQFQNQLNPFGTVFNPVSIKNILERIVNQHYFTEKDLFFHQGLWKSFELHSGFNQNNPGAFLLKVNKQIQHSHHFIKNSQWLFITLGTAWVYKHNETGRIVSNCHKVAQTNFEKLLLSPEHIVKTLHEVISLAHKINPHIHILFSISPVRHLKDGFIENQRSKSHLATALHKVIDNRTILYFPSYEIMMDDLRDYRFYEKDYVHPNGLAIDYIWEKFTSVLISPAAYQTMKTIEKLRKSLQHKAFQPDALQEIERQKTIKTKIENLQKNYPWMDF